MLTLPSSLRVFAKTGPTDMRKSFEGLVGVVERELGQQVESGDLFLFFNRRGDRVKVLWFAGDGLVIWYKRLEGGTFEVPKAARTVREDGSASPAGIEMCVTDATLRHPALHIGVEGEHRVLRVDLEHTMVHAVTATVGHHQGQPLGILTEPPLHLDQRVL